MTLTTGVMMLKIQLCVINCLLKYIKRKTFVKINAALVSIRDFFLNDKFLPTSNLKIFI